MENQNSMPSDSKRAKRRRLYILTSVVSALVIFGCNFSFFLDDPAPDLESTTPTPALTSVTPNSGSTWGETEVTLTGTSFVDSATVTFGDRACTNVNVVSETQITCTTPAHASGAVTVTVTNSANATGSLESAFTYVKMALTKISDTSVSDVSNYDVTPDGTRVVYIGTNASTGIKELYATKANGSSHQKINGTLVSGGNLINFAISPDSRRVAYLADQDTDTVNELFIVNIDGTSLTKLNSTLVSGGDVSGLWFSPDSSKVIYRADQDSDTVSELYVVNTDGSSKAKLNEAMVSGGDIFTTSVIGTDFPSYQLNSVFSHDSTKVLYAADRESDEVFELYVASIDGSDIRKVSGPMVGGGDVKYYAFNSDSTKVVYLADEDTDGSNELYSVNVDGSSQQKLNTAVPGTGLRWHFFLTSEDKCVYLAWEQSATKLELYSVNLDGTGHTKLNQAFPNGGNITRYGVTPDGLKVIYSADAETDELRETYIVGIEGSAITKLNDTLPAGGDVGASQWGTMFNYYNYFQTTSDSTRIVYSAEQETDDVVEFYSIKPDGTSRTKLNGTLVTGVTGVGVCSFILTPDSSKIIYYCDQETDEKYEVYSTSLDGTGNTKLSGDMISDGDATEMVVTSDSSTLVFLADKETNAARGLYAIGL